MATDTPTGKRRDRTEGGKREIVGFSLPPALAEEVRAEAKRRDKRLKDIFTEAWDLYRAKHRS